MPDHTSNHPYHELPNELIDKVIGFLPRYRFVGANSVHTVCQNWNDLILDAPTLRRKRSKTQIVNSVETEEEALLCLSNENIFNEIRFDKLMKLSLKIAKVREIFLPLLSSADLIEAGKGDISITRNILANETISLNLSEQTTLKGHHEVLAKEYLDQNPTLFLITAYNLSFHINIAKRILALPGFSAAARYSICLQHDLLVDQNLSLVQEVHNQWNDKSELHNFARSHAHRRNVAEFIMDKFADKLAEDPLLYAIMGVHHLDIAKQLFKNKTLCKRLDNAEYLRNILNAHFEICEMVMEDPELISTFVHEDVVFVMFIMHFPRSNVLLNSKKSQLSNAFFDTYGSILELPLVKKLILEAQSQERSLTSYDFKLALANNFLLNPSAFEKYINQPQPNFLLIDIFEKMKLGDLRALQPLILKILADASLRNVLPLDIIHTLARRLQFVREYIVSDEKLISEVLEGKFSNYHNVSQEQFLFACPKIERKILGTLSLRNLLNDKQVEVSSNRQHICEHLKGILTEEAPLSKKTFQGM